MTTNQRFLDAIEIAAPCPANWDEMAGDDRKRFCQECQLNVYNLSGMTADAAVALVQESEGRLCVRLFRRDDGTVLTEDCPVGWAAVRRRARLAYARVVALLAVLFAGLAGCIRKPAPGGDGGARPPVEHPLMGEICVPEAGEKLMGKIQMPPPEERPPQTGGK